MSLVRHNKPTEEHELDCREYEWPHSNQRWWTLRICPKPPPTHMLSLVVRRMVCTSPQSALGFGTSFFGSGSPPGLLKTVRSWRIHGGHEPDSVHHEVKLGELLGPQVKAATKASMIPATRMPCCMSTKNVLKMRPFRMEPGPIESVAPFQSCNTPTFTYPSLLEDYGIGGSCRDRCIECE